MPDEIGHGPAGGGTGGAGDGEGHEGGHLSHAGHEGARSSAHTHSDEGAGGRGDSTLETLSLNAPQFRPAARHPARAEQAAALCFLLGMAGFAGFGAAYWQNAPSIWLGATLGGGMLATGAAMVVWGKYLMPKGPFEEPRHRLVPTPEERENFLGDFSSRGLIAIQGRRKMLAKLLGAASGILGIVAAFPLLRSLGPLPEGTLFQSSWKKGARLTRIDNTPVKVGEVTPGSLVTVFPPDDVGGAMSQTNLLYLGPNSTDMILQPGRESWSPQGYIAYSRVCTHAGCPVALYQRETQQLLCPCHQSLFDVLDGAIPVFGPAPRPLPQLPLFIDSEGYLCAQRGYDEAVGPGFWERGNSNG